MNKIGGSNRVREELTAALAEGRGVTAKVKWVTGRHPTTSSSDDGVDGSGGRNKWIHCTPLVGSNGNIGVWMIVIVDDEGSRRGMGGMGGGMMGAMGGRQAPPVAADSRSGSRTPAHGGRESMYGVVEREARVGGGGSVNGSVNSFQI